MRTTTIAPVTLLVVLACSRGETAACPHRVKIEIERVDDGSKLMQNIQQRLASHELVAPAGIAIDLDRWSWDEIGADGLPRDHKRFTDPYLRADDLGALQKYLADLGTHDPALKPEADHRFVFEKVISGSGGAYWRSYYVFSSVLLDDRAIASAGAPAGDYTPSPKLEAVLSSDGATQFADVTRTNAGHKLAMLVDGVVSSAPIINGEIKAGKLWIVTETSKDASSVVERLRCTK